jgi:hypothetical protein
LQSHPSLPPEGPIINAKAYTSSAHKESKRLLESDTGSFEAPNRASKNVPEDTKEAPTIHKTQPTLVVAVVVAPVAKALGGVLVVVVVAAVLVVVVVLELSLSLFLLW